MATSVMLQKLGEGMVTSLWIFAVTFDIFSAVRTFDLFWQNVKE